MELLDLVCRKQMFQGSGTLRTSLMAEASRKAAQLTAKEKSTGLSLSADHKESPGAVGQAGRKYRDVGQCMVVGKQQALQPGALPTAHPGTRLKGRSSSCWFPLMVVTVVPSPFFTLANDQTPRGMLCCVLDVHPVMSPCHKSGWQDSL